MILYRPRANDYYSAMHDFAIFNTVLEMEKHIIDFHNLYNLLPSSSEPYILTASEEEKADKRNGWLHSRYICLGNTPLGVFDAVTLANVKKPKLEIEEDTQGGLKCQFELLGEKYLFFLDNDPWYGQTKMLGYMCSNMSIPHCRLDDVPVSREAFTLVLEQFIGRRAVKVLQTPKRKYQKKKGA